MVTPAESPPNRAVFLDRDGVLVVPEFRDGRSFAPRRLEDFHLYPDADDSVRRLKAAGYLVIVVTNQPDVSTGLISQATLDAMHARMTKALRLDGIEVCTDTREAAGRRRKPAPGMLLDAAAEWGLDLASCIMIGDRWSDVEAAKGAGCPALFIDRGYTAEDRPSAQLASFDSLAAAVDWLLSTQAAEAISAD